MVKEVNEGFVLVDVVMVVEVIIKLTVVIEMMWIWTWRLTWRSTRRNTSDHWGYCKRSCTAIHTIHTVCS